MKSTLKQPPVPPLLALSFGILAVSTASIFIRYALGYAPALVVAAYRLTIATLVLAPLALIRYRKELGSFHRKEILLALCSGIFLSIHFATWITSLELTTVASSVVFVTTTPLFVALLAPVFLKEKLTRLVVFGMLLALAGGIVVGLSDSCTWQAFKLTCPPPSQFIREKAFLGDLLALAGAVAASFYVMLGRRLRSKMSLVSYIFVVYGMAAVGLVFLVLGSGETPWNYPAPAYLWFILVALVPQLIGHTTFNWALGYLSAAFVSITLLGEPIGSTILAYLLLKETPTIFKVFGAILILAGILIASRSEQLPVEQSTV